MVVDDAIVHEDASAAGSLNAATVNVDLVETHEELHIRVDDAIPVDADEIVVAVVVMPTTLAHWRKCQSCTRDGARLERRGKVTRNAAADNGDLDHDIDTKGFLEAALNEASGGVRLSGVDIDSVLVELIDDGILVKRRGGGQSGCGS
jgi:hypothetical protein